MPSLHETAYPRLRASVTAKVLADVYTPTVDEISLAESVIATLQHLNLLGEYDFSARKMEVTVGLETPNKLELRLV